MSYKKNLGQYFTSNIELKKKVFEFILNVPLTILEPSIGRGDLTVTLFFYIFSLTFILLYKIYIKFLIIVYIMDEKKKKQTNYISIGEATVLSGLCAQTL